jgi:hypothetical protein
MKRSTLIAVSALTAAIVIVPTVATAANGGSWLLGRANTESATTTVTTSVGTPLSLNAQSGYAPLKVNSGTKVTNLNADKIDGLDSTSFLRSTGKAVDADKVDGYHASSFSMRSAKTGTIVHDGSIDYVGAKCPTGTTISAAGGAPLYGYALAYSGPDWDATTGAIIPNSWYVVDDQGYAGYAYVTCLNPSGGAVPGAITSADQLFPTSTMAMSAAPQSDARRSTKNDRFIKH